MSFVPCPRCAKPLDDMALGKEVHVDVCSGCSGMLVMVPTLVPLLRIVAGELLKQIDVDQKIEPVPDHGKSTSCPACGSAMGRTGYLGTNVVHIDRCATCQLIWIDPGELSVMGQLFARTERRTGERFQALETQMEEMDRRIVAQIVAASRDRRNQALHAFTSGLV